MTVTLTDSHSICDYLNAEFGGYRLLAARRRGALASARDHGHRRTPSSRPRSCAACRAAALRQGTLDDFIAKMRDRQFRCYAALEKQHLPDFGATFDLAQITTAVACSYDDWRYGRDWRGAAPKLAAGTTRWRTGRR